MTNINVSGDAVTEVLGLTNDMTVSFADSAGGVEATIADGNDTANVVLTRLVTAQTLNVGEETASDVTTVNVTGSVAGAGAVTIDLDAATTSGTGLAAEATLNLAITSNSAVTLTTTTLETLDASKSTGDLTFDLETDQVTTLTSVKLGAGDDTLTTEGTTGATNITIEAGKGADTINISTPAGSAVTTLVFNAGDTGKTAAKIDEVAGTGGFVSGTDKLDFNLAKGSATNFVDGGASSSFTDGLTNANTAFDKTVQYFFTSDGTDGWLYVDRNLDGTADEAIQLTGVTTIVAGDIIA